MGLLGVGRSHADLAIMRSHGTRREPRTRVAKVSSTTSGCRAITRSATDQGRHTLLERAEQRMPSAVNSDVASARR